jgi:hypothetical protein
MKNILKLHEAIVVVLLNCKGRTAAPDFIATIINKRGLYKRNDEKPLPPY